MVMVEYQLPSGVTIDESRYPVASSISDMYNMDFTHSYIRTDTNKYCVFRYRTDSHHVIVPHSFNGDVTGKTWKKDGVGFSGSYFYVDSNSPDKITMVLS